MKLLVDFREKEFIDKNAQETEFVIQVTNLHIGDFIIQNGEEIVCIIERKTCKDLLASIIDGRFRQQKERMLDAVQDPSKILFIIEGSKKQCSTKTNWLSSVSMLNGAIQNMLFKHAFKVIMTENVDDRWQNIKLLCKKLTVSHETTTFTSSAPVKL